MKKIAIALSIFLIMSCTACNSPTDDKISGGSSDSNSDNSSREEQVSSIVFEEDKPVTVDSTFISPSTPQPFTLDDILPHPSDKKYMVPTTDDYVVLIHTPHDEQILTVMYSYNSNGDVVSEITKLEYGTAAEAQEHLPYYKDRLVAGETGWTSETQECAVVDNIYYERSFKYDLYKGNAYAYYKAAPFSQTYNIKEAKWRDPADRGYLKYYFSIPTLRADYEDLEHPTLNDEMYLEPIKTYDKLEDFKNLPTDAQYKYTPMSDDYLRSFWREEPRSDGQIGKERIISFAEDGSIISQCERLEFTSAGAAATFLASITSGPTPGYDLSDNYIYVYKPFSDAYKHKYRYLSIGAEIYLNGGLFYMTKPYLTEVQLANV